VEKNLPRKNLYIRFSFLGGDFRPWVLK